MRVQPYGIPTQRPRRRPSRSKLSLWGGSDGLQARLQQEHNVSASTALICTSINKLGLTLKKAGRLGRTGRISPRREANGGKSSLTSILAS
jgi:hypothetical protein